MTMPQAVRDLIRRLEGAGFEAYAVGGCVRDSLLGLTPHDWDVCSSASPDQMKACFAGLRTIDTGIKHGTLTVLIDGVPYELTSFRADGAYTDHRRPDHVQFVSSLEQDLARRDFTINAMALSGGGELIDPFGGRQDLANGLMRCVGQASDRFEEDALRILRALRFASCYDFRIERESERAMRDKSALLRYVSAERVWAELRRILCGSGVGHVLLEYPQVLGAVLPEILPALGFGQHNPHHDSDVWGHTARAVQAIMPEPALRLTMLLHDLGKPQCFTLGGSGVGHFYGHAKISERMAEQILTRLRVDNQTRARVLTLIRVHDVKPEQGEAWLKRRLNAMGERAFLDLLRVQRADACAQSDYKRAGKLQLLDACEAMLKGIMADKACFSLGTLAVNGGDLMGLGIPQGRQIGLALHALLQRVIEGELPNERGALLEAARAFLEQIEQI